MAGLGGSSGGNSGAIRAGKAFVEVGVDDTGVKTGIGRIQGQFRDFGKELGKFIPEGKFKKFFEMAGRGGAIGVGFALATPVIQGVKDSIEEAIFKTKQLAKESESLARVYANIAEQNSKWLAIRKQELGELPDPRQRVKSLEAIRDSIQKDIDRLRKQAAAAGTEAERRSWGAWLGFGENRQGAAEKNRATFIAAAERAEADKASVIADLLRTDKDTKAFLAPITNLSEQMAVALDPATESMGKFESVASSLARNPAFFHLGQEIRGLVNMAKGADAELKRRKDERERAEQEEKASRDRDFRRFEKKIRKPAGWMFDESAPSPIKGMGLARIMNQAWEKGMFKFPIGGNGSQLSGLGSLLATGIRSSAMQKIMKEIGLRGQLKDAAHGAFATPFAGQQFGDMGRRKMEGMTDKIAKNTLETVKTLLAIKQSMFFV